MLEKQPSEGSSATAERIREFVLERFPVARTTELGNDDPLLEAGIVDSLGILELVDFVTTTFGIVVSDEDLVPGNFESVTELARFVAGKQRTAKEAP